MKQFYTVLSFLFFAFSATAQFTEKFENYEALSSNSWKLTSTLSVGSGGNKPLEGATSISTQFNNEAIISTPYLDFTGTSLVSFQYRLQGNFNLTASRLIEIGTTDKNGTFVAAASITVDKNTSNKPILFSQNLNLSAGTKRFTIRVSALQGSGKNADIVFDDLSITAASLHYTQPSGNTAPEATDANFATISYAPFKGNLSPFASDANTGESLTFSMEALLTNQGSLVVNADGSFEFTPNDDFMGGNINFTYKVTDDGYDPLSSNTANVTISFPARIILPVHVSSFTGSIANQKAQLTWSVAQNEDGSAFEVEKSGDGRTFTTVGLVKNTQKPGAEQYNFTDAGFSGVAHYRLKVINKTGTAFYSKTVLLKEKGETSTTNLTLLQNPVISSINFTYKAANAGSANVSVYTSAGVKVSSTRINMQKGFNQTTLQTDNKLAPGAYILEVVLGTERSIVKLIKL